MTITFEIPGDPRGKGRPKFSRMGAGVRAYTDAKTASYENLVRLAFEQNRGTEQIPTDGAVEMFVEAQFALPKSSSKRLQAEVARGIGYAHTKRPDLDNIVKAVLDGLNGVAFTDDARVSKITASKTYAVFPRVLVTLLYGGTP